MAAPLELFDYQTGILELLRAGFAQGHRSQILVAPTGAGKTEMAIALLQAASKKGSKAAMLLDRVVLCDQTSQRLQKYGIDHGVMQSGHWRYRPYENIQVCSAQTLEKRGSFPGLQLLIVDEAHQTRAQTVEFIKSNPQVRVVGLSATPFTKGLGKIYDNVISSVTTQELVNIKRLVPLRVFVAKEIDMEGAKKVAGEWSQDEVTTRGMQITGDIVSEWVKKTHEVFGGPRKTVVFCAGVAHGADLAQKFAEAGYNFVSLSYKDDDQYKQDAIAEFSKADSSIHGLIATDILTKGFDVSDVMIGVSARPFSKSLSSHIQQMGRVMRSHPDKEFGIWLCLARGSRVLTDRGLVPIEKVSRSDKIWDGTNYVAHGGAVCNGIQNTITYQGLTATPGHLVHTAQGWRTFGECAREQIAITQTGFGGQAIRLREDHQSGRVMARGEVAPVRPRGLRVRKLWQSIRNFAIEFGRRAYQGLPSLQPASAGIPAMALRPSTGDACALPQPEGFAIPDLWRARRGVQVRGGEGRDAMDHGEPWHPSQPGMDAIGSYRPRGALRAGQHSLAHGGAQPTEQAWQSSGRAHAQVPNGTPRDSLFGQHAQAPVLERDDGGADHRAVSPTLCEAEREVWDILDAGPCNRFTCEGLLVHNCHSGNYLRFRDDWDDVFENGVQKLDDGREKPKKEPSQKEKEAAKCPKCSAFWPGNSDTCPNCGHVRLRRNDVESVPGYMEELAGASAARELKRKWLAELKFVCSQENYSPGWVAHKFKEKFGSWPNGINVEPAPASLEVQRWLRSRRIAWAKARKAA